MSHSQSEAEKARLLNQMEDNGVNSNRSRQQQQPQHPHHPAAPMAATEFQPRKGGTPPNSGGGGGGGLGHNNPSRGVTMEARAMENGDRDPHITQAYTQFKHRLTFDYKICDEPENKSSAEIENLLGMKPGNTSQLMLDMRNWCSVAAMPLCCICFPYILYYGKSAKFIVPANHFALVEDHSRDKPHTNIYGPGYHFLGLYKYLREIHTFQQKIPNNYIMSPLGDLILITVDQGTIALFEYNGQSKIFGPGLHMVRDTMQFIQTIQLDQFYIKVGPEKWITIPDQYDGIAINNGKTMILEGGKQHHLFHENYKFAKLVPKIILTDRIVTDVPKYIENLTKCRGELPVIQGDYLDPAIYLVTKTKDGANIYLDTMLFWEIQDTAAAAHKAMNVMELKRACDSDITDEQVHIASASRNIDNLRKTVLRFAKSFLSEAVGHVCMTDDESFFRDKFSEKMGPDGRPMPPARSESHEEGSLVTMNFAIQNFLNCKTGELVNSLNNDLHMYGVSIKKLTINNAMPMPEVQEQLDKQAKAKIDRNTALVVAETKRQVAEEQMRTDKVTRLGEAKNRLEAARISKLTLQTQAEGEAEKERIIALGKKDAAELQESTALGKQLAMMDAIAGASKAFNSGSGEKVYVVGTPMEALTTIAGSMFPGVLGARA